MSQQQGVIKLLNFRDGEYVEQPYKLFSVRLPEFLKRFPPDKGWRVVRSVQSACELSPVLTKLHEAAITAGKSPESLGIPPIPSGFVMTARLLDSQGNEVASGSAFSMGLDLQYAVQSARTGEGDVLRKDFEAGETAAFQRLLAAVGLGGDVLDADESHTIKDMGKTPPASIAPVSTTTPAQSGKTRKSQPQAAGGEASLLGQVNAVPCAPKPGCNTMLAASAGNEVSVVEVGGGAGVVGRGGVDRAGQAQLRSMQQQIGRIAKQLRVDAVPVVTLDEATAELARLGDLVKQAAGKS
ncbi:hypothetical protein [Metallibacterium scheffleri]|uniref:Uncharacterized protein n=1 Tax=Metallibacterium scheffleri TaxID=993689 RepID=A0A4V3UTN8_9GAMM|nr:hypothetical protein [Metallibacterium scheffleri]THD11321.1 hypothetical protein B1806_04160 [Metallibacterium scheffleri]